jgi:hypothetical protein
MRKWTSCLVYATVGGVQIMRCCERWQCIVKLLGKGLIQAQLSEKLNLVKRSRPGLFRRT